MGAKGRWYSVSDLAGLPGLPGTTRGVSIRAKKKGWRKRPRKGRGGGSEYAFASLPIATQDYLRGQYAETGCVPSLSRRFHFEKSLLKLFKSWYPSIALACLLTAVFWTVVSVVLIFLASLEHHVPVERIVFFSYLSPNFLSAVKAGHVPLTTLLSDKSLLAGLGALWAVGMVVTALSLILPLHDIKPMHMQVAVKGFFCAYVLALLIYGGFTISHRYVPGILRILWIVLLYALAERLKRSYPPKLIGAEYFSPMVDGLFAVSASFIIAQGIDRTYDQALSGPVFILLYFAIMLIFGRRMLRRLLLRQLYMRHAIAPDIELPEDDAPRWRQGLHAMTEISIHVRRKRDHLVLLPFDELLAEYKRHFHGKERRLITDARLKDATPRIVAAWFTMLLVWGPCVLLALWAATNANLYMLGIGR